MTYSEVRSTEWEGDHLAFGAVRLRHSTLIRRFEKPCIEQEAKLSQRSRASFVSSEMLLSYSRLLKIISNYVVECGVCKFLSSYWRSTVTMAVSCIIPEIFVENRDFS